MAEGEAEDVDTGAAEAFERLLVPPVFGPWSRALVDLARPRAGERVIDIACGTGVAARTAMGLVGAQGAVCALDIDAGMIAHAGTLEEDAAIDWRRADVMDLPFADDAFDVALCNQGLQFFPDRIAALREIRRVLRSGARLALERLDADGLDSLKREVADTLAEGPDADGFAIVTTSHMMLAYA